MTDVRRLTVVDRRDRAPVRRAARSVVAHVLLIGASIADALSAALDAGGSFRPENEIFTRALDLAVSESSFDAYRPRLERPAASASARFFLNSFVISVLSRHRQRRWPARWRPIAFARLQVPRPQLLVRA